MLLRRNRSTAALSYGGSNDSDDPASDSGGPEGACGISLLGLALCTSSAPVLCVESEAVEGPAAKEDGDRHQSADNSSATSATERQERTSPATPSTTSHPGGNGKDSEGDDVVRARTLERRARALEMMQARKNAQAVATETAREEGERRRARRMEMESQGFDRDGDTGVLDEAQLQALRRDQRLMDAAARRRDNDTAERQRLQERREQRTANAAAAERRREESLQATRARRPGARSRAGDSGVDTVAADGAEEEEEEPPPPPPPSSYSSSSSASASAEPSIYSIRRRAEHQAELTRRRNARDARDAKTQTQIRTKAEIAQRRMGGGGGGGGGHGGACGHERRMPPFGIWKKSLRVRPPLRISHPRYMTSHEEVSGYLLKIKNSKSTSLV